MGKIDKKYFYFFIVFCLLILPFQNCGDIGLKKPAIVSASTSNPCIAGSCQSPTSPPVTPSCVNNAAATLDTRVIDGTKHTWLVDPYYLGSSNMLWGQLRTAESIANYYDPCLPTGTYPECVGTSNIDVTQHRGDVYSIKMIGGNTTDNRRIQEGLISATPRTSGAGQFEISISPCIGDFDSADALRVTQTGVKYWISPSFNSSTFNSTANRFEISNSHPWYINIKNLDITGTEQKTFSWFGTLNWIP